MDNSLNIGDLVIIRKELQKIVGINYTGIIISETKIIPSDIEDIELEEIDSFNVYFPNVEEVFTIPKTCLEKLPPLKE